MDIVAALRPLADPARAAGMRAYMKDQFWFLGIPTPLRRSALKPFIQQARKLDASTLLETAQTLWHLEEREFQYAAIDLLASGWKPMRVQDLPALLALTQQKSWWDTVDGIAGVVNPIVRRACAAGDPAGLAAMDAALMHENLWVRRTAMIHQLHWKGETDVERLFAYARQLAPETDFFIRKAIGWALRDYAWHDPKAVITFVAAERARLSPLTIREALKNCT